MILNLQFGSHTIFDAIQIYIVKSSSFEQIIINAVKFAHGIISENLFFFVAGGMIGDNDFLLSY